MMRMLVVTNYQNIFLTGSAANPLAKLIESSILEKVKNALECGDWVVFTYDNKHAQKGDPNWNYPDSFNEFFGKYPDDIFQMPTASTELLDLINAFAPWDEIEVCGIFADSGVVNNCSLIEMAEDKVKNIVIDTNAIAGTTREKKDSAIETLSSMNVGMYVSAKNEYHSFLEEPEDSLNEI